MDRTKFRRVFLIVLDSVGIGAAPDAKDFDDQGADTLGHIAERMGGLNMPNMENFGLGNARAKVVASNISEVKRPIAGIKEKRRPIAHFGIMKEASNGKDTMTGHWEIMGLKLEKPFRTFPEGFPAELISQIEQKTRRRVIGNQPASGTEIIRKLGPRQIETGDLIVYTSADSVLQIAAHEEVIPLTELYEICQFVRELTKEEPYRIGRVIARPYVGEPGNFTRTANRHDYALKPPKATVMNALKNSGYDCIALGKIDDIYDGEGVTKAIRTKDNMDGIDKLLQTMEEDFLGLAFLNLVDFDAKYGHRRDPEGYGRALEAFDARLPEILDRLTKDDLFIITADHGNDPTHHGTDHTREVVPLFVYYQGAKGRDLGIRSTFADVGATIADHFHVSMPEHGESFLQLITGRRDG